MYVTKLATPNHKNKLYPEDKSFPNWKDDPVQKDQPGYPQKPVWSLTKQLIGQKTKISKHTQLHPKIKIKEFAKGFYPTKKSQFP